MKLKSTLLLAATCLTLAGSAFAEHAGLLDATTLDGTDVWDFHGKKLGDVKQILIDPHSGRVRYAIIEVDKAWELIDPEIAVPWAALRVARKADRSLEIALDSTKERLADAPRYKMGDSDRILNREGGATIYSYWRAQWYDDPAKPGTNVPPSPNITKPEPAKPERSTDPEAGRPRP
jgi:sporulation protein YlmC with PRC-barrel domain